MRRKSKIGISLFLFSACIFLLYYFSKNDLENNIIIQETTWTEELGFINWGHANSSNTKEKLQELLLLSKNANMPFEFTYSQRMRQGLYFTSVVFEYRETFVIPPHLGSEEIKSLFLQILLKVSHEFEKKQGSFPLNLIPGSSSSSFRNGDMMGNLVSYYSTVKNTTSSQLKTSLNNTSVKKALTHINDTNNWQIELKSRNNKTAKELYKLTLKAKKLKITSVKKSSEFYLSE